MILLKYNWNNNEFFVLTASWMKCVTQRGIDDPEHSTSGKSLSQAGL